MTELRQTKSDSKSRTVDSSHEKTTLHSTTSIFVPKPKKEQVITPGEVYCLSISKRKGTKKLNVSEVSLIKNFGIAGDAHAGSERQISLLPYEAFDIVRERLPDIKPGDFAENITTRGIDFSSISVGDCLWVGAKARLVVTHIGKECHEDCFIKQVVGDCIMPRLGIFASITEGGLIRVGDSIRLENTNIRRASSREQISYRLHTFRGKP